MSLTPRQKTLLDFIVSYQKEKGYTPTYGEMSVGIGNSPKSVFSVHRMVQQLKDRGYVTSTHGSERSIQVLRTSPVDAPVLASHHSDGSNQPQT